MKRLWLQRGLALLGLSLGPLLLVLAWFPRAEDLPGRALAAGPRPGAIARCATCHAEIVSSFSGAPHARTLQRADPSSAATFVSAGRVTLGEPPAAYQFFVRDQMITVSSTEFPDPVRVDWLFGSGRHAVTPVSVWETPDGASQLLEHRVSWYPPGQLGPTLGQSEPIAAGVGLEAFGTLHDAASVRSCFGCHTTYLPQTGERIHWSELAAGIRCQRCHPGADAHAEHPNFAGVESWSRLSPLESVNRCGECHRRADHFTPEELRPDNPRLARFASVGLVQSRCFQEQGTLAGKRFDCTSCHDPHGDARPGPAFLRTRCFDCHGPGLAADCSAADRASDCRSCHLPSVQTTPNLRFTDHWIRRPGRPAASQ